MATTPAVVSLHEAPDAEDIELDNQHLVDWIYNHAAPLADDFRTAYHDSFAGVNRSNATAFYQAANNYTNWTTDQLDQLEHDLDPSHQTLQQLHANATQLTDPGFTKRYCPYPIQYAQPSRLAVTVESLYDRLGLPAAKDDLTPNVTQLTHRHEQALTFTFDCLDEAALEAGNILANLNKSQTYHLLGNASKAENHTSNLHNLTTPQQAWLADYLNLTDQLDPTAAANATSLLFDITDQLRNFLTTTDRNALNTMVPIDKGGMLFVGSSNNDTYTNNAIFTLDLNGSDTYLNNAGGADAGHGLPSCRLSSQGGLPCEIAATVDLGPGDDSFTPTELKQATVGSAFAGVGFLFVEGGENYYETAKWVAGGHFGAGTTIDVGDTTTYNVTAWDRFENSTQGEFLQPKTSFGAGQLGGRGLLVDLAGDDMFHFEGVDGIGYSGGGLGALVNDGGNDTYLNSAAKFPDPQNQSSTDWMSGISMGHGEFGGIGIFLDLEGDDDYSCTAPIAHNCQGGSFIGGAGILLDPAGDDQYLVENETQKYYHSARGQGSGQIGGTGVLRDGAGSDEYESASRATGFGGSAGIGLLIEESGNDSYISHNGSAIGFGKRLPYVDQVSEQPGLGLLWDAGGSDTYSTTKAPSLCGEGADESMWIELDSEADEVLGLGIDEGYGFAPTCL